MKPSEEEISAYRREAEKRRQKDLTQLKERRQKAWCIAYKAAKLLRERYNASRVVVFGSILREDCFGIWSDIDIAAWGIVSSDTFRAMGDLMDLSDEIDVALVDITTCRPGLREAIERKGKDI